jgi:hypothetical protein
MSKAEITGPLQLNFLHHPVKIPPSRQIQWRHVFDESGREVRKMAIKVDDETIWVDCIHQRLQISGQGPSSWTQARSENCYNGRIWKKRSGVVTKLFIFFVANFLTWKSQAKHSTGNP